jgi:Tol biopolymer transport system component
MNSPNNKLSIGITGCSVVFLCLLTGLLYYLWQYLPNSHLSTIVGSPTSLSVILPTAAIPAPDFSTATLLPSPGEKLLPTSTASPIPKDSSLPSGKIVFTCFIDQIDQICLMNADGTGQVQRTRLRATAFYASLAPDGQTIYFSSRKSGNFEIYSIPVSGGEPTQLTDRIGSLFAPELSPNGQQIVFTNDSAGKQGLWIMSVDGSDPRALTNQNDIDPAWSPDGTMIAFASTRQGARQLFIMNADGSNIRQVTNLDNMGGRSTWSPDGSKLAFYAGPANNRQIYVINIDGTGLVQLTDRGSNVGPSWSPDGNWIAFTSFRDENNEIYIMHPDGTEQTRLTNNSIADWQPRWGK